MIINSIIDFFFTLCRMIIDGIYVPDENLINDFEYYIDFFYTLLDYGIPIYDFFMPADVIAICLDALILFEAAVLGYYIFMWLLEKIPMLGIKD